jgi:ELWxxDGT repeat protein
VAGTTLVQDFSSADAPFDLTASGSTLFFTNDVALWSSNGTAAGTTMLATNYTVYAAPGVVRGPIFTFPPFLGSYQGIGPLAAFNGGVVFAGTDPATGLQLWSSAGTVAGTALLKDINTGTLDTNFAGLAADGNKLIFQTLTLDDPTNPEFSSGDYQLWVSNGTAAGTTMLLDFGDDTNSLADLSSSAVLAGNFYFIAPDNATGAGNALWATNGTAAGTQVVMYFDPGLAVVNSLTVSAKGFYFVSFDGVGTYELWHSDGTAAGTVVLRAFAAGDGPANLTNVNGTLYFSADDGVNGPQLWKSDGTAAGTTLVAIIDPGGTNLHDFVSAGGKLYFGASDGVHGDQLWKSNGTGAGTKMVAIIDPTGDATPMNLVNDDGTVYFTADDGVNGRQLWKSNGTAAGTMLVTVINTGSDPSLNALTVVGDTLYFVATDVAGNAEMWTSDGTAAGTIELTPDTLNLVDNGIAGVDGTAFFAGYTEASGFQLWASNGTVAGTVAAQLLTPAYIPAISQGFPNLYPADFTATSNAVYFDADDIVHGRELWKAVVPVANLSGPNTGTTGQQLTFMLKAHEPTIHDPSAVYTFIVNWGDGGKDTLMGTTGTADQHTFAAPGTYTVTLTAVDQDGLTSLTVTTTVTISLPPAAPALALISGTSAAGARNPDPVADIARITDAALQTVIPSGWAALVLRDLDRLQ